MGTSRHVLLRGGCAGVEAGARAAAGGAVSCRQELEHGKERKHTLRLHCRVMQRRQGSGRTFSQREAKLDSFEASTCPSTALAEPGRQTALSSPSWDLLPMAENHLEERKGQKVFIRRSKIIPTSKTTPTGLNRTWVPML